MNAPHSRRLYHFGDHRLAISAPLQTLVPADPDSAADISVTIAEPSVDHPAEVATWRHQWIEADGRVNLSLAREETGYRLRFHDQCDFLIDSAGSAILAQPLPDLSTETFEHLLVDQALPRVLSHRGELVAHASVVEIGNVVATFIGRSGWGKSTLASLLHGAGHRLLSDDCAVLRVRGEHVEALPTYPSLRMYEDSIGQTVSADAEISPVATYTRKKRVTLDPPAYARVIPAVRAIYLLNDPADPAEHHTITPLSPMLACMAMIEHSFRLDVTDAEQTRHLLAQAATVLRQVPAFSLRYPRDYTANQQLVEQLLGHINTAPAFLLPSGEDARQGG